MIYKKAQFSPQTKSRGGRRETHIPPLWGAPGPSAAFLPHPARPTCVSRGCSALPRAEEKRERAHPWFKRRRQTCSESMQLKRYRSRRCGGEPWGGGVRLCPARGAREGGPGVQSLLSARCRHGRCWSRSSGEGGQVVLGPTTRLQKFPQRGRVSLFSSLPPSSSSCSALSGNTDQALPAAGAGGCCWLSLNHIPQFPPKPETERGFCL